jgi:hypothetical protein
VEIDRIDSELKNIDKKYAETLKILEKQSKIRQNQLMDIQISLASIEERTREIREQSAATRDTIEAASALTTLMESVRPNAKISSNAERMKKPNNNKIKISSEVMNMGQYPFSVSISVNVVDEYDNSIDVKPIIEGAATPFGIIMSGQNLAGTIILVFPEDWVSTFTGTIYIVTSYNLETVHDVIDSVARNVNVRDIKQKLEKRAKLTTNYYGDFHFR